MIKVPAAITVPITAAVISDGDIAAVASPSSEPASVYEACLSRVTSLMAISLQAGLEKNWLSRRWAQVDPSAAAAVSPGAQQGLARRSLAGPASALQSYC